MRSRLTRREFLHRSRHLALGLAGAGMAGMVGAGCKGHRLTPEPMAGSEGFRPALGRDAVSIVKIRNGKIAPAVEEALDLLGGVETVARGKERVLLKPNLVTDLPTATTRLEVVETLARLMKQAGKDVSIGEGSAAVSGFNARGPVVYRVRKASLLEPMQRHVFERLGYDDLASRLGVPLVNLHVGEMARVKVPGGLAWDELELHRALVDTDLLCSVPMMKTHSLASVTLGMKNLIGLYAGSVYGSVRSEVHSHAADRGSPGIAYETLDMVRANKLGLVVVDASRAMEGDGPTEGTLVDMGLIIAGTNALATDMVAAAAMGFAPAEVPTFACAHRAGMTPTALDQIEIRGAPLATVQRTFVRPRMAPWNYIRPFFGAQEL